MIGKLIILIPLIGLVMFGVALFLDSPLFWGVAYKENPKAKKWFPKK